MNSMGQAINYKTLSKDFIGVNAAVGGALLSMFVVMLLQRYDIIPSVPCGIYALFGIYCPGCGGTRSLFALLHGHVGKSLICNPAVLLGIALVLYYEIGVLITLAKKNGKYYFCTNMGLILGYLVVIVVFAVVRDWLLLGCQIDMLKDFV